MLYQRTSFVILSLFCLNAAAADEKVPSTAYACTVDTLQSGKKCFFDTPESKTDSQDSAAVRGKKNSEALKKIAPALCQKATKVELGQEPVNTATDTCIKQIEVIAAQCSLDGEVEIINENKTFHSKGKECYLAVQKVLSDKSSKVPLLHQCCQCLQKTECHMKVDSCVSSLAKTTTRQGWRSCMGNACAVECGTYFDQAPARHDDEIDLPPPSKERL